MLSPSSEHNSAMIQGTAKLGTTMSEISSSLTSNATAAPLLSMQCLFLRDKAVISFSSSTQSVP